MYFLGTPGQGTILSGAELTYSCGSVIIRRDRFTDQPVIRRRIEVNYKPGHMLSCAICARGTWSTGQDRISCRHCKASYIAPGCTRTRCASHTGRQAWTIMCGSPTRYARSLCRVCGSERPLSWPLEGLVAPDKPRRVNDPPEVRASQRRARMGQTGLLRRKAETRAACRAGTACWLSSRPSLTEKWHK